MKVERRGQETLALDYNWARRRVRGFLPLSLLTAIFDALKSEKVTIDSLLAFLAGGGEESNLAPGATPIDLKTFMFQEYLPKRAARKLKQSSYEAEDDQCKRLGKTLGDVPLHEIRPSHAEKHKKALIEAGYVNNTIAKDLRTLGRLVVYGVEDGRVKKNPLLPVRGLPPVDRSMVWLRLPDIVKLLWAADRMTRKLILFLILTGARIKEALEVKATDVDWKRGVIRIPTEKRRGKAARMRDHMRRLDFSHLGPRFVNLLKVLRPHPETGYFFSLKENGAPMNSCWAEDLIAKAVRKAGLSHLIPKELVEGGSHDHVIPHDLRRTMTNHAAIAGWKTQEIRAYLGQRHTDSIDAYLDNALNCDPAESIFFDHHKVRRAAKTAPSEKTAKAECEAEDGAAAFPSAQFPAVPPWSARA